MIHFLPNVLISWPYATLRRRLVILTSSWFLLSCMMTKSYSVVKCDLFFWIVYFLFSFNLSSLLQRTFCFLLGERYMCFFHQVLPSRAFFTMSSHSLFEKLPFHFCAWGCSPWSSITFCLIWTDYILVSYIAS